MLYRRRCRKRPRPALLVSARMPCPAWTREAMWPESMPYCRERHHHVGRQTGSACRRIAPCASCVATDATGPFLPFSLVCMRRCGFTEPAVRTGRSIFSLAMSPMRDQAAIHLSSIGEGTGVYFVIRPLASACGSVHAMIAKAPRDSPIRAQIDSDGALPGSTPVMNARNPKRFSISSRTWAPRMSDNR